MAAHSPYDSTPESANLDSLSILQGIFQGTNSWKLSGAMAISSLTGIHTRPHTNSDLLISSPTDLEALVSKAAESGLYLCHRISDNSYQPIKDPVSLFSPYYNGRLQLLKPSQSGKISFKDTPATCINVHFNSANENGQYSFQDQSQYIAIPDKKIAIPVIGLDYLQHLKENLIQSGRGTQKDLEDLSKIQTYFSYACPQISEDIGLASRFS